MMWNPSARRSDEPPPSPIPFPSPSFPVPHYEGAPNPNLMSASYPTAPGFVPPNYVLPQRERAMYYGHGPGSAPPPMTHPPPSPSYAPMYASRLTPPPPQAQSHYVDPRQGQRIRVHSHSNSFSGVVAPHHQQQQQQTHYHQLGNLIQASSSTPNIITVPASTSKHHHHKHHKHGKHHQHKHSHGSSSKPSNILVPSVAAATLGSAPPNPNMISFSGSGGGVLGHHGHGVHSGVHQPPHTHARPMPQLNPNFQYSKCTGRKKALCIGINYYGQRNELKGCNNDARHVKQFLIKNWGFRTGDIVFLSDESRNPREHPTRRNMIDAMKWLVKGAQMHDSLFFHYSGHGGQTEDVNGDEVDGFDEVIYPVDFKKNGHITDDEMHDLMVKPLPKGCRLTALFDSCHSGTVLDLPYIYSSHGRLKGSHVSDRRRRELATAADVISWSGCKDGQTSADTFAGGVAVGAMSYAFIKALTDNRRQSYAELLRTIRLILHPRFSQKPQLGSSHHIDTGLLFVI